MKVTANKYIKPSDGAVSAYAVRVDGVVRGRVDRFDRCVTHRKRVRGRWRYVDSAETEWRVTLDGEALAISGEEKGVPRLLLSWSSKNAALSAINRVLTERNNMQLVDDIRSVVGDDAVLYFKGLASVNGCVASVTVSLVALHAALCGNGES